MRGGRTTRAGLAAVALLALAGCSGEPPPPQGADGSGVVHRDDRLRATVKDPEGAVVGRARAEATADGAAARVTLSVSGLEPGTYRVALAPGATCDDDVRNRDRLPDLEVGEAGSASYDATTGTALGDLADGAALRLVGGSTEACGRLADY